jgi:hypothetical protein
MKVRSLYLVNLAEIIQKVEKSVLQFSIETGIELVTDLTNLFISRVFLEMSEVYKHQHEAFVSFYLDQKIKLHLLDCEGFIKYQRFFRIMELEVKFPVIIANIEYEKFAEMMKRECPEYDEVVANHRSFVELFPKLKKVILRAKYNRLNKEVVEDIQNRCKMMLSL